MRCIRLRYLPTSTRGCSLFLLFSTSSCHKSLHPWSLVMEPVSGVSCPGLFSSSSSLASSHSNDDRESPSDVTSFSKTKENVWAAVCPCVPVTGRMLQEMGRKVRNESRNWNIFNWLQTKKETKKERIYVMMNQSPAVKFLELCYFFIASTPPESICQNILSALLARKSKSLWYSLKYHFDTNPRLLQSLVGIEPINIPNGALFYFQSASFVLSHKTEQWVPVVKFILIYRKILFYHVFYIFKYLYIMQLLLQWYVRVPSLTHQAEQ